MNRDVQAVMMARGDGVVTCHSGQSIIERFFGAWHCSFILLRKPPTPLPLSSPSPSHHHYHCHHQYHTVSSTLIDFTLRWCLFRLSFSSPIWQDSPESHYQCMLVEVIIAHSANGIAFGCDWHWLVPYPIWHCWKQYLSCISLRAAFARTVRTQKCWNHWPKDRAKPTPT